MAYATLQDLISAFGERKLVQLTDRAEPPADLVDAQVAGEALGYADNLIDGYLAARYVLPLRLAQPMLKGVAQDIAYWRLHDEPTEEVRKRYEAAVRTLKALSEGEVSLPGETGAGQPAGGGGVVRITSQDRIFSRDRMEGL